MARRGFGMAAAAPDTLFGQLAAEAERQNYHTFWVNDTPGADGFQRLSLAAESTSDIRLGVGVVPVDRRDTADIVRSIELYDLPVERLVVGIGAGRTTIGSLELVGRTMAELRNRTDALISVGALGPRMVSLAGREADAVLLNWLTPEYVEQSRTMMKTADPHTTTEVIGYVRVGGPGAESNVELEAERYEGIPQYGRHFAAMGVRAVDTCAVGSESAIEMKLREFDDVLDETVVRAVAAKETLEDYLTIIERGLSSDS